MEGPRHGCGRPACSPASPSVLYMLWSSLFPVLHPSRAKRFLLVKQTFSEDLLQAHLKYKGEEDKTTSDHHI